MPNYSLVVDSKFKPFSLQDMLVPVMMESNEHKKIQENLADLNEQANVWKGMISPENDPVANAMYQKYADDLTARADNLQKYGLNFASRQDMYEMKSRYKNEIQPIETAFNRRRALDDEQRKALATDPTKLYERMAKNMSLDEFIANPEADYGRSYSGALITQQVANAASNIAKEARDSEEGRRKLRRLLPYQYELMSQKGFSRESVMKAIMDSPDADKILTGLVEDAMNSSGVRNWSGDQSENIARALDYAKQGLWSAIGETSYNQITDQYNMQNALRRVATQEAQRLPIIRGAGLADRHIMTGLQRTKLQENVKQFDRYFNHETGRLTQEGINEFYRIYPSEEKQGGEASTHGDERSPLRKFLEDDLKVTERGLINPEQRRNSEGKQNVQPGNIYNAYKAYASGDLSGGADTMRYTEWHYDLDNDENLKRKIITAQRGNDLVELDFKDGKFVRTKNKMSLGDFSASTVSDIGFSSMGLTFNVLDKKGNTHTFTMPMDVNNSVVRQIRENLQQIGDLQTEYTTGKSLNTGRKLNERELAKIEKDYNILLQQVQAEISQLDYANKTKDQTFDVFSSFDYDPNENQYDPYSIFNNGNN